PSCHRHWACPNRPRGTLRPPVARHQCLSGVTPATHRARPPGAPDRQAGRTADGPKGVPSSFAKTPTRKPRRPVEGSVPPDGPTTGSRSCDPARRDPMLVLASNWLGSEAMQQLVAFLFFGVPAAKLLIAILMMMPKGGRSYVSRGPTTDWAGPLGAETL